ncbi:MAG: acyltransferase family protein [Clostridia bacterium]|nr:acyltransferase family protein [Clostridia bacterium]
MDKVIEQSPYADAKGRLYYYDNAKFILIFLVVLAHAISPFREYGESKEIFMYIWRVINTLHMPCLIFISGFFAKKFIGKGGAIKVQRVFTYVMYYAFAQITVGLFETKVLGQYIGFSFFNPRSSLWFLACLIWWYSFLPLVDKIKPEVMIPVAFILAMAIGYDQKVGNFMSISRAITQYPFFLCGYYFTPEMFSKIYSKKGRILSIPIGLASLGIFVLINIFFKPFGNLATSVNRVITCNYNYNSIFANSRVPVGFGFLTRLAFFLLAAGLCYTFLAWTPRKKHFFTKYGARTLAVYILHRYLYLAYRQYEWFTIFDKAPYLRWAIIPVAFIITFVFSTYPFWLPFKWLGQIKITKLLKDNKPKNAEEKSEAKN